MDSKCVYLTPLYLFTEIEAKEACDWLKAAGFPQYAQLYEGTATVSQLSFFSSFSIGPSSPPLLSPRHPSILLSPIVRPAVVYFQASALERRDGSWERPVRRSWDSRDFSSAHFSTFLLRPCPQFPRCHSNIIVLKFLLPLFSPSLYLLYILPLFKKP